VGIKKGSVGQNPPCIQVARDQPIWINRVQERRPYLNGTILGGGGGGVLPRKRKQESIEGMHMGQKLLIFEAILLYLGIESVQRYTPGRNSVCNDRAKKTWRRQKGAQLDSFLKEGNY